jgi:hypothetical protein
MMEGSAIHMSMLHKESDKQEVENLEDKNPVAEKASAVEMSPYKMDSALHQEEKKETKKDSVKSKEDKDLKMMQKLQSLKISFDSGKEKPKEQIKKQLEK